ncbi:MAG: ABC transporter permease [Bacteroidaceae bacterium]|nr:ABC transporter permease [Bacteroidaceae bacterium]
MTFELFIARRIYSDNSEGEKRFSRPAVRIALAGIAIGIAVMIISLSVVFGFKREVAGKVIGFGSHIQLLSLTQSYEREMLPVLTNDSLLRIVKKFKEVDHVQAFATKMGILKTEEDFCGITFKGLSQEYDTAFLHESLIAGTMPRLNDGESSNELLISNKIARMLHLQVGSKVFAYFVSNESMRARRFKVCGIFETNMSEYDTSFAMTDIHTVRKLNNWDDDMSSGYEITIKDFSQLRDVTFQMAAKINKGLDRNGVTYGVFSIKELAPHTFSWLAVLDMNVVMIIILMICVSVFTVVSGLLIIMLERINMIGILKALGATNFSIRKVFMNFAIMLVGKGLIIGNIAGLLLCYVQNFFHLVRLDASIYYLSYVPVEINYLYILLINLGTILITSLVIFGSSYLVSISKPAKTMRWD